MTESFITKLSNFHRTSSPSAVSSSFPFTVCLIDSQSSITFIHCCIPSRGSTPQKDAKRSDYENNEEFVLDCFTPETFGNAVLCNEFVNGIAGKLLLLFHEAPLKALVIGQSIHCFHLQDAFSEQESISNF